MCTLTYIPVSGRHIITSNRDEHSSRSDTAFPTTLTVGGLKVWFPKDPKAGGTWIGASERRQVRVLLNGAFEKHRFTPPYRKSRGLVLLESFEHKSLLQFSEFYDLGGIEPFTLVQFDPEASQIIELRWDGTHKHLTMKDNDRAHIWSSVSLYRPEIIDKRRMWFAEWLASDKITPETAMHFHEFGGKGDAANNFLMDRGNGLSTVSISQVVVKNENLSFSFRNLLTKEQKEIAIYK